MALPSSTYRIQVRPDFDLYEVADLVEYLVSLGVAAIYLSPVLESGSDHGYDVIDPTRIDTARGGQDGWRHVVAAARSHRIGIVVDIVPNHLGVADAHANSAWADVLRFGSASRYAPWFDIDWTSGRLLLPVLGDDFDPSRDLAVVDGELRYHEHRFPIAPGTEDGTASEVHDRQHYQLVNYRRADTEQNYRRFFAIPTLAGVRVEDLAVFNATHRLVRTWVSEDGIDGLRIDHPDGLADPAGYLARLRELAPDGWIVVEKILEPGEELPAWPVDGTTGYDALDEVSGALLDPSTLPRLDTLYRELTGDNRSFADHVEQGKRLVATTLLQAEVNRLARLAPDVPNAADALTELLVAFPVYRSYLPDGAAYLAAAITVAEARRPDLAAPIAALAPRLADPADEICVRFQQTSGSVMAKGVEDTAYYRYNRFVARNEVGGDPGTFGAGVDGFHTAQQRRAMHWPAGMTTVSTHDTKRSEDVRARMLLLAEFPDEWDALVRLLMVRAPVPNRAFGYLLWQTFVGTGLIARRRMHAYAEKAMREASDGTSWVQPNEAFEAAVHAAIDTVYDVDEVRRPFETFLELIEPYGWRVALSQKLVQLTMPGVPDVYQGMERWDDSLVDPDNRRAVDFARNASLLQSLDDSGTPPALDASGAAKLWLVSRVLRLRRGRPQLFTGYSAMRARGVAADHAVVFDRGGAMTVATRLPARLDRNGGWRDTVLEVDGAYVDVLTGGSVSGVTSLADVLAAYPVALLIRR